MTEEIDRMVILIDKDKKQALRNRAFDLRLVGGMTELVNMLIDKELKAAAIDQQPAAAPAPTANQQ